jgi:hypothetical protein
MARSNLPILTLDRFEQAMQIARLAGDHDLPELSLRAVHDALRGGPPVVQANPGEMRTVRMRSVGGVIDEGAVDPASPRVVANLLDLDAIWQKHKFAAGSVYEALRDAVMPPGRPGEMFIYATPLDMNALRNPRSAGRILAAWAARAGKAAELRQAIDARNSEMARLPGSILRVQLGLAAREPEFAKLALQGIAARMKNDTSRTTSELACHAAIPAVESQDRELAKLALEVLDSCSKGLEIAGQPEPVASLLLLLARRHFELRDEVGGRKRLDSYLDAMEKNTVRYSGDYSIYLRKQQLERVASEYARAGLWPDALLALGKFLDAPMYSGGDPPVDSTLVRVLRQLEGKQAKERYEALHSWTMPEKDRRSVRMLTAPGELERPPGAFWQPKAEGGSQLKEKASDASTASGSSEKAVAAKQHGEPYSTAAALIDAARGAGTLEQLAQEAKAAALLKADRKVENADTLHLLVELARGQGAQAIAEIDGRTDVLTKENNARQVPNPAEQSGIRRRFSSPSERLVFSESDFRVACAALADPARGVRLAGLRLADALGERAKNLSRPGLARVRARIAEETAREAGAAGVLETTNLARWHDATVGSAYESAGAPALWTAQDGLVAHLAGSAADMLLFDYPLQGSYRLTLQAYRGPWAESAITHNGLVIEPFTGQGNANVSPVGDFQAVTFPWTLSRQDGFSTITVEVSPKKVRYLVNGHLFYSDDEPGASSPWVGLFTYRDRHSVWKNIAISGDPVIPRELTLCQGDRLDGWISTFYGETQPPRLTPTAVDRFGNPTSILTPAGSLPPAGRAGSGAGKARQAADAEVFDWAAVNGVIHGRRLLTADNATRRSAGNGSGGATEADQSRLFYFRPLHDGDSVSYEFLYEPGQVMVHPAIGRLVFLCEPGGLRLHWMTGSTDDVSGLAADNAALEPENRRGPKELPLEPGKWNAIKLSLDASKVTLELNRQTIYVRTLEPGFSRQFGLFHYKDQTSARARNVVLRGRWPETIDSKEKADLTLPGAGPDTVEARRARRALIDEWFYSLEAGEVLAAVRKLAPGERYEKLAAWVLPAPDRPAWRLSGELSASFPAPECAKEGATQDSSAANGFSKSGGESRLETGGQITAPALELVATAQAAGKLDALADRVRSVKIGREAESPEFERARLCMLGLIQVARRDDEGVLKTITAIEPLLAKLSPMAPVHARWPDLLLATRALERAELRIRAAALLDLLIDQTQKRPQSDGPYQTYSAIWDHVLTHERAHVHLLALDDKERAEGRSPSHSGRDAAGWARVTHSRAETRGQGLPMAQWDTRGGEIMHHPGHDVDMMYLSVPLRGDFQLDCELSTMRGRNIRVMYGGVGVNPTAEGKKLERFQLGRPVSEIALNPLLEKLGDWTPFRLVVKNQRMTAFLNGRQISSTALPTDSDPWLALLCRGRETGTARKIAITGNPSVPEKLKLSALPDLEGWLVDEYGQRNAEDPDWDQRGEEITGKLILNAPGSKQERVLRYHRPMLENGRIEYDFYFDPGKVMVHPAVDRVAFLIDQKGVRIHRLTDGAFERGGLAPENTCDEPANRRGPGSVPLKAQSWNHLILRLSGDTVALELNGQPLYERRLEPENQRTFGLFHYADETQVRARNVTYEGSWPKAIPEGLRQR